MTQEVVLTLGINAIKTALFLGAPLLVAALAVGILVSLFQAITQINEATLAFIPKIVAVIVVIAVCAPWMMDLITNYTTELINNMPALIR